jgi:hypothetical protein
MRGAQRQLRRSLHAGRSTRLTLSHPWTSVKREATLGADHSRVLSAGKSCRSIHIPTVLLPPVVFTGLLVGLWIWYVLRNPRPNITVTNTPNQEMRDDGGLPE